MEVSRAEYGNSCATGFRNYTSIEVNLEEECIIG